MPQKVFKTGHSLAVTVPARFVRSLGLRAGALVKTKIDISRLKITFEFSGTRQLPLLGVNFSGVDKKEKEEARN